MSAQMHRRGRSDGLRVPAICIPMRIHITGLLSFLSLCAVFFCPSPATGAPLREMPNGGEGGLSKHATEVVSAAGRIAESDDPVATAKAEAEAVLNGLTNSSAARRHACITIANIACDQIPLPQAQNLCREHAVVHW